jgi:U32 family peptidase
MFKVRTFVTEMIRKQVELMAPAGSFESLRAAIQAGADSIYFGVEQLNMRVRSGNSFTIADIAEIVAIARHNKLKCYLTLNTVLYNHDLTIMKCIVEEAKKFGINAIIASDPAVLQYARKLGVPIHISTQANVSNIQSVEFFADYADVIVLARELSLKQVDTIVREIKRRQIIGPSGNLVGIEIFAHGALCMAISGKCYLSLHSDFASANRGACIQNCRHTYLVTDKETGTEYEIENEYIMSAKDLCTIDFVDQLIESGASVLKIEGRGRSAEYVYTVTKCYRDAINAYNNGTYCPALVGEWKARLATVFNRGFWDGYYLGRRMGEWSDTYGSKATKRKVYVGRGLNYFKQAGVAEFIAEAQSLSAGDEVLITGPTTGVIQFVVNEMRVDGISTSSVKKGEKFTIALDTVTHSSDRLYKLQNVS